MKSYDETPWWCQLVWPWFGPLWYAEIEDPDAFWAAIRRQFARQVCELANDLAGDDRPGEGYLAKAGRLTAARYQAEEIIRHEYGPPTPEDEDDECAEPVPDEERPMVVDRNHLSWAEVNAEQQERIHDPGTLARLVSLRRRPADRMWRRGVCVAWLAASSAPCAAIVVLARRMEAAIRYISVDSRRSR